MVGVTWFEAAQYCRWLSEQEVIPDDQMCYPPVDQIKPGMRMPEQWWKRRGYRLPTEGEWEYACRAGSSTRRSFGALDTYLSKYAWYKENATNRTHPVGQLKPNDLGFFDIYGNASEWCQDVLLPYPTALKSSESQARSRAGMAPGLQLVLVHDPVDRDGVIDDKPRVLRGGSVISPPSELRSAYRASARPSTRPEFAGFRVARTVQVTESVPQ